MTQEPLLSVKNLTVEYVTPRGNVRAVDNVSFEIGRGEVFGLAGESGSGKSTAAMAAMRLLQPPAIITGGEVLFEGQDILAMTDEELRFFRWKKIALVFQSAMNALNPVLTVGEQIADVLRTHEGMAPAPALERASELLQLVGIEPSRLKSFPHQLSGGMRQRVVIAIALALKPPLLFMDEPTTALDVVVQKEILQQIAELKDQLGFSILFITHDLSLMLEFCDKVGILYAGRLAEIAPAKQLFGDPQHPYTRGLMHSFPELHGSRHRMEGIPGSPPDMRQPPKGCRFHPRCKEAGPECELHLPRLVELGANHYGACVKVTPSQIPKNPQQKEYRS
ncbi:MAG: ABC transporter ATP-binding protein [Polyangiaceae bacterium]|nr:ABC transporter ATP-binding protein [Polyangiaceae bacterium]